MNEPSALKPERFSACEPRTVSPRRRRSVCIADFADPVALATTIVALVILSRTVATFDQSDYSRAIDFLLTGPLDGSSYRPMAAPTIDWGIKAGGGRLSDLSNSASFYFWLVAVVQRVVHGSFNLIVLGSVSKALVVLLLFGISTRFARQMDYGRWGKLATFGALASCFFMAHNLLFFNSFYQEHIVYLAIPCLIYGILDRSRWRRNLTVIVALTFIGTAKIQYFYLPFTYLLIDGLVTSLAHRKADAVLVGALLTSQVVCAFALTKNNDRDYNYYHSAYFGSYVVSSPSELDDLGVPASNRRCIGVDAFGISLAGIDGEHEKDVGFTCYVHRTNVAQSAMAPYLNHPGVLFRLWSFAARGHWTAKYFLMDVDRPYVVPIGNDGFGAGQALLWLTDVRDRWVTRSTKLICAVSFMGVLLLARYRFADPVIRVQLFLLSALASQIIVALVGEGMRDLSKHWAIAQLCLDLTLALTLASYPALVRRMIGSRGRIAR